MPRATVPEPMLTILPYLRAIMCGTTCLTIRNGPRMLIAITRSHSSTSISSTFSVGSGA